MHNDPRFFDEPHLYKPDRFETSASINKAYMPTGLGPRMCIGTYEEETRGQSSWDFFIGRIFFSLIYNQLLDVVIFIRVICNLVIVSTKVALLSMKISFTQVEILLLTYTVPVRNDLSNRY